MENRTLQGITVDDTAIKYGSKFIDYLQGKNVNNLDEIINKLNNIEGFMFIYYSMLNTTEQWGKLDLEKIKHDTNKDHKEFFDKLKILFGIANSNNIRLNGEIKKITIPNNYFTVTKDYIKEMQNSLSDGIEQQKVHLEESQKSLSKGIEQQKVHLEESQKSLSKGIEQQKVHLKKYTNKLNNIYSDFIAILGIFTAITFAIFGGMNLLTNLFKNTGSTASSLGYTLILAAIFGLIMWGITELLFYWISKIKGITDSTKDKNKILFNWIAIIVLTGILIIGVLLFTKK